MEEDEEWLRAPVICKTNRERLTIIHHRMIKFAKRKQTVIIRWQCKYRNWIGKPKDDDNVRSCLDDPAFYEYFVKDADVLLTDTVCKNKKLCNGTHGRYHSLVLDEQQQVYLNQQLLMGKSGDVITLERPPLGINVKFINPKITDNNRIKWKGLTVVENEVVLTIRPWIGENGRASKEKDVPLHSPCSACLPSKVSILTYFPLQPRFAITVDKAQGQTLDRVIVALSKRELQLVNFTYPCLYVAFTRVRRGEHLQILLSKEGNDAAEWESITYVTALRPEASVKRFFKGFEFIGDNPLSESWSYDKAIVK